jgi:hypothetical protein
MCIQKSLKFKSFIRIVVKKKSNALKVSIITSWFWFFWCLIQWANTWCQKFYGWSKILLIEYKILNFAIIIEEIFGCLNKVYWIIPLIIFWLSLGQLFFFWFQLFQCERYLNCLEVFLLIMVYQRQR